MTKRNSEPVVGLTPIKNKYARVTREISFQKVMMNSLLVAERVGAASHTMKVVFLL